MELFKMENQINIQEELSLKLTYPAQQYLLAAGKWATFIGIAGFVFSGFIALLALIVGGAASIIGGTQNPFGAIPGVGITIMYLVVAGLNFAIAYLVFSFGKKAKDAINTKDENALERSVSFLKQHFSLIGILIIIYLALILIGFIVAIAVGVGTALT